MRSLKTRLRFALLATLLALVCAAPCQTLQQYLSLRKKHGIYQAVGIPALETFVGARTMEVQGVVKGTIKVGERQIVMVERSDGGALSVYASKVPDWLIGNSVPARLLVHAERSDDGAEMTAWLLGVAPELDIAKFEAEARKRAEAKKLTAANLRTPPKSQVRNWSIPVYEATYHYASFIKGRNKRLTDSEAWEIARGIVGFSVKYGVDARLIMAMVMVESGFNPNATSRAGAQGLGQLMPGTARDMGITDSYDTLQNLYGTVRVIRGHMERYYKKTADNFASLVLGLAAYNAGSGSVRKYNGVPPFQETQNYIRKVVDLYDRFRGVK